MRSSFVNKIKRWADCPPGMRWISQGDALYVEEKSRLPWYQRWRAPKGFAKSLQTMSTQLELEFREGGVRRPEWIFALARLRDSVERHVQSCRERWGRRYRWFGGPDLDKSYQTIRQVIHDQLVLLSKEDVDRVNRWMASERGHLVDETFDAWRSDLRQTEGQIREKFTRLPSGTLPERLTERIRGGWHSRKSQALVKEIASWIGMTLKTGNMISQLLAQGLREGETVVADWELLGRLENWAALVNAERRVIRRKIGEWSDRREQDASEIERMFDELAETQTDQQMQQHIRELQTMVVGRERADLELIQALSGNFDQIADHLQEVICHLDTVLITDENLNNLGAA